jgi:dTDP-4-dehydrorhamnose 3,5-epimerase
VPIDIATTSIDGLCVITMHAVGDDRGVVREFFRDSSWREAGLPPVGPWGQFNVTETTRRGAIRGLHGEQMTKLVGVAAGAAFGAYVDTRRDSPSFQNVVTVPLEVGTQVLVPNGVCNGFQVTTEGGCTYVYCFDREWQPGMQGVAIHSLDPALGIAWPVAIDPDDPALLSAKDRALPTLAELLAGS